MMKKKDRKQRSRAGFSLAELLITLLILLMVSGVIAAGMPLARTAYENAVDVANAQTLLSTTATVLRTELGNASEVTTDAGHVLQSYRSSRTGMVTSLIFDEHGIKTKTDDNDVLLVTAQAATKRLHTEYESITYQDGVFTITNLVVKRSGAAIPVATLDALVIRTTNPF